MNLKSLFLALVVLLSKWIGKIHAPFTHKRLSYKDFLYVSGRLLPGDVLLGGVRGELSSLFISGKYTHAAIYMGDGVVIEAVGKGVIESFLMDFMLRRDYCCAVRAGFCDAKQADLAAMQALEVLGSPYDYEFQASNKSFYCAELIQWAYTQVVGEAMPFTRRKYFGNEVVLPQDYRNACDSSEPKWSLVVEV